MSNNMHIRCKIWSIKHTENIDTSETYNLVPKFIIWL